MNKRTNDCIKCVEAYRKDLSAAINKNACEIIEKNLNPHNHNEVTFALNDFLLLCYRKQRARCFGSFDFQKALWITYTRDRQGIWVCDEDRAGIELLENMPVGEAMEVFNAIVEVIKSE